jgi:pimeloyl-ACP methyl ester carboxylesterase
MVALHSGQQVWLAETAGSVGEARKDLVLCVHGMSGAATNWTDLMAELAPDFDCVAVDLPGSGFSPPPKARFGYSITAHANTVIALIETLTAPAPVPSSQPSSQPPNQGGVHLIGNSMGGAVAVRVAASRPDLVRTLTLISPALPVRMLRRETAHFPVIALPFVGARLVRKYARLPAENRVAGVFQSCYYDPAQLGPERFALEVADLRQRDELGYDADVIVGAARTLVGETLRPHRLSLWRAAERVTAPTLVTFGSHDQLVPPRLAATAARAFPDVRVAVLPLTGHIAQMERPGLVAARFREMVAETSASDHSARGNSGHRDPVDA